MPVVVYNKKGGGQAAVKCEEVKDNRDGTVTAVGVTQCHEQVGEYRGILGWSNPQLTLSGSYTVPKQDVFIPKSAGVRIHNEK